MKTEVFKNAPENNYEQLLEIRLADMDKDKKYKWLKFAVTANFTIFVTPNYHEHLLTAYGVDLDRTLTEGDIHFNDKGEINELTFKHRTYQPIPGFKGTPEELALLQEATEKIIRKTLNSEKNKSFLINN